MTVKTAQTFGSTVHSVPTIKDTGTDMKNHIHSKRLHQSNIKMQSVSALNSIIYIP